MDLKPSRLFQPRNPLFWVMLILNGLSAVLAWVLRSPGLETLPTLIVGLLALSNAALGILIAFRLMQGSPERDDKNLL